MFLRCFGDVHMWGQIWPHKVWASLCQVLFFSNLLHSHGVWHFDIWQIISKYNMSCDMQPFTPLPPQQPPAPPSPNPNPTPNEPACVILTLLDILVIPCLERVPVSVLVVWRTLASLPQQCPYTSRQYLLYSVQMACAAWTLCCWVSHERRACSDPLFSKTLLFAHGSRVPVNHGVIIRHSNFAAICSQRTFWNRMHTA